MMKVHHLRCLSCKRSYYRTGRVWGFQIRWELKRSAGYEQILIWNRRAMWWDDPVSCDLVAPPAVPPGTWTFLICTSLSLGEALKRTPLITQTWDGGSGSSSSGLRGHVRLKLCVNKTNPIWTKSEPTALLRRFVRLHVFLLCVLCYIEP